MQRNGGESRFQVPRHQTVCGKGTPSSKDSRHGLLVIRPTASRKLLQTLRDLSAKLMIVLNLH